MVVCVWWLDGRLRLSLCLPRPVEFGLELWAVAVWAFARSAANTNKRSPKRDTTTRQHQPARLTHDPSCNHSVNRFSSSYRQSHGLSRPSEGQLEAVALGVWSLSARARALAFFLRFDLVRSGTRRRPLGQVQSDVIKLRETKQQNLDQLHGSRLDREREREDRLRKEAQTRRVALNTGRLEERGALALSGGAHDDGGCSLGSLRRVIARAGARRQRRTRVGTANRHQTANRGQHPRRSLVCIVLQQTQGIANKSSVIFCARVISVCGPRAVVRSSRGLFTS